MPLLNEYEVTVRVFDPTDADGGSDSTYVLPVDSPDAEHAVAAAMSNAVAFTQKIGDDDRMLAVAFCAVAVRERR